MSDVLGMKFDTCAAEVWWLGEWDNHHRRMPSLTCLLGVASSEEDAGLKSGVLVRTGYDATEG